MAKQEQINNEKFEHSYRHILNQLNSIRDIATEHNLDTSVTHDLETQQGIIILNKKTGATEEYRLLELLKYDYNFDKGSIEDFRHSISKNILNFDEFNETIDEFYPLFMKQNINSFKIDNILYRRENELVYLECIINYLDEERVIITVEDISKYVQDQLVLEQLALNNDILIKEVHHRVKNNLQVLLSLMRIQESFKMEYEKIIEYMKLSVSSMALTYNQLCSDDLNYVSLKNLLEDFKVNIDNMYMNQNIKFNVDINKDAKISIDKSNPLCLIINELIVNSVKYAWDENDDNKVIDCLFNISGKDLEIDYKNNGKYVQNDMVGQGSLESILIESLVGQVDGTYEVLESENYHMYIKIPIK